MRGKLRADLEKFMKERKYSNNKIGHITKQLEKKGPFINFQHLESLLEKKEFVLFNEMNKIKE